MGKPGSKRQKEYLARLKEKEGNEYLKKERERKNKKLDELKKDKNSEKYKEHLKRDRERKALARKKKNEMQLTDETSTPSPGSSKQSLGKSVAKAKRALPKSSPLKVKVISAVVKHLTPRKKRTLFSNARVELAANKKGRPSIIEVNRAKIVAFLEQPDIGYCAPGRKDTVYCGKSKTPEREKIYRPRHYLFHNIQELTSLYNNDNDENVTYYQMREVIASEKHLITQNKTPEDDCRCETCENAELLLEAIKKHFRSKKQNDLVKNLPVDPLDLVEQGVCSIKVKTCMEGECSDCPGAGIVEQIMNELEKIDSLDYYQWVTKKKNVCKILVQISGEEAAEKLMQLVVGSKMRMHRYNIYRQYSELKWLKQNLGKNETILSVDFAKNYENKQKHEVQSAYFGHENFTIFTAAAYFYADQVICGAKLDKDVNLLKLPIAIVSNETTHDRNVAFTNNIYLINMVKEMAPAISTFHFWSDGCAGQFRSKYVFRSFTFYPNDINLTWNYGEAHHFKGPHDGIGGTIKRKVYREVLSGNVVIENAKQFSVAANDLCDIKVAYLDASDVQQPNLDDSIYTLGTLKVHQAVRVDKDTIDLFFNSTFKTTSDLLKRLSWSSHADANVELEDDDEEAEPDEETTNTTEVNEEEELNDIDMATLVQLQPDHIKDGTWVLVIYDQKPYLGKVVTKSSALQVQVRCLENAYGDHEPQMLEPESQAIYYEEIYEAPCIPKNIKVGRKYMWKY